MADEKRTYWAADETSKAVAALDERVQDYYDYVNSQGFLHLWRASNRATFAGFYTGGELGRVGKQSEFRTIEVNDFGNLHQHLFTLITSQKPAWEARTETADAKAMQQAPLGTAVADTAWTEKGLRAVALTVADTMLRAGEAYGLKRWDPTAGPVYNAEPVIGEDGQPVIGEDGEPVMQPQAGGDVEFTAYHPLDVARDWTRPAELQRWWTPRRRVNRWDLAAQFPDLEEKILNAPSVLEDAQRRPLVYDLATSKGRTEADDVWVKDGLFVRSPALPDGRLLSYVTPDCVLFDGPLPYREMPLYRAAAKEMEGTAFGYSLLWDVLAPQIAQNNLLSTIMSAAANLGLPTVWQPDGNGLKRTTLQGINVLQGGTTPPQVLALLNISPELFKLAEMFQSAMERLSGVNSVVRGQVGEGMKGLSGAAYAFFGARAIEFGSRFQEAYNHFLESIASGTIYDYQDMGAGEYLISLAGEGNSYRVEAFQGGRAGPEPDPEGAPPRVDRISKMRVQLSNPIQSTTAGKQAILDYLIQVPGAIQTPAQVIEVLNTGKVEPATKATQRELEAIARENERLSKGEPVVALATDRHWMHISEHMSVAATPEARENQAAVESLRIHVLEEHIPLLYQTPPALLIIQGAPPELVQAIAMSVAPPPLPGPTNGTAPPQGGDPSVALAPTGPGEPAQPEPPADPLSGEAMPPMAGM
jgi:hypothetical protein